MSIILYNKLVRDKVPEQIERSGKSCTVEVVDDDQYRALLDRKLDEEMDSYQAHRSADDLKSGTTVIFHVDALDAELTLRVLDYLSGVAYCTGSEIRRIAVSTYLITPPTVQVIQMRCD